MLTWDIVNIAAIHKQVTVLGVADGRQIGGVRCTGSDVAPHAACRMKMEIQSKGVERREESVQGRSTGQEMTSWQKLQQYKVHIGQGELGRLFFSEGWIHIHL